MSRDRELDVRDHPAFDVDGMLGGLAKWLRILGFDTAFPCKAPSKGRIFVTAGSAKRYPEGVYVTAGAQLGQLREVQEQTRVSFDRGLLLSRCLEFNEPVYSLPKGQAIGRVPKEILCTVEIFQHCPVCGKVFWEGSHRARIETRLADAGIVLVRE